MQIEVGSMVRRYFKGKARLLGKDWLGLLHYFADLPDSGPGLCATGTRSVNRVLGDDHAMWQEADLPAVVTDRPLVQLS
jgi:hypothetical protein